MAEDYFRSHGAKTVFLGELRRGSEKPGACLAGASKMSFSRFMLYSATGSSLRASASWRIGYAFGANLPNAIAVARSLNGWVCGLITCLLVVGRGRLGRKAMGRAAASRPM